MKLSSKERMLASLNCEKVDYIPCSFMLFNALRAKCKDDLEFFYEQINLGLDTVAYIPFTHRKIGQLTDFQTPLGFPVRFDSKVKTKEWKSKENSEEILNKEYLTPEGKLEVKVKKTEDWIFGDRVPILNDWLSSRSKEFIVKDKEDLKKMKYLLTPPNKDDIETFRIEANEAKKLAEKKSILLAGMWGIGLDSVAWIIGLEKFMLMCIDDPDFAMQYVNFIYNWNKKRMEIILDFGVDLFVRRGWYEGVDFYTPNLFKKYIFPSLKKEAKLCHQAGSKYGYILTRGSLPLIDQLLEAEVDVLIGVDSSKMDPYMDIEKMKEKVNGRMSLWGGINQYIAIEGRTEKEINDSVKKTIKSFGETNGFILSPVDNVLDLSKSVWAKVETFIKVWKELR